MSMIAKDNGGNFVHAPIGSHPARCYSIIDLGYQKNEYEGQTSIKQQVLISWELPLEDRLEDGNPIGISKFYTMSLNDKANLCIDLSSWRGKSFTEEEKQGFDVSKLLGVPCMLSIVDKNGKSKVSGVMGLPKGLEVPEQINESVLFDMDAYSKGGKVVFDKLSEGLQGLILKSESLKSNDPVATQEINPDFDDDIPF